MTIPTSKKDLYQWLSESKTYQVIAALRHISETSDDADFQKTMLLQSAQVSDWQRAQANGTLTRDELRTLRNRIHAVLISCIDDLSSDNTYAIPTDILAQATQQDRDLAQPEKKKRVGVIVGVSLAMVFFLFLLKKGCSGTPFTQTFIVADAKGGVLLSNDGFVVFESKFGKDSVRIGDNGQASKTNLSDNFKGEPVTVYISHPQPYQVAKRDSVYTLSPDMPIKLVVALQYLDKLEGEIRDENGNPLDSVRASIQNLEAFTNKNGWFSLSIPPERQAAFHRISLDKKGYQSKTFNDVPIHTKRELTTTMKRL